MWSAPLKHDLLDSANDRSLVTTVLCSRSGGDVMVIEVQRQTGQLRGRVIAVLCPPGTSSYG